MKVSYILISILALANIHWFNDYAGHTLLSILITAAAFLVSAVAFLLTRRKPWAYIALILAASMVLAFSLTKLQAQQRKANAERILAALANYKQENNAYPRTLEHLSPGYMDKVPRNWFGFTSRPFQYKARKNGFLLTLEYDQSGGRHWDSGMGAWDSYD